MATANPILKAYERHPESGEDYLAHDFRYAVEEYLYRKNKSYSPEDELRIEVYKIIEDIKPSSSQMLSAIKALAKIEFGW